MTTHYDTEVKAPVLKLITAWLAAGFSNFFTSAWESFTVIPWDKLASFAAFIYTTCLAVEWIVKKWRKWRGTK